ncbi:Hypothetical protein SRAE_1000099400 [Strongyloides ratti]|uniref:Uncharacterized protein n=1 Tax=Strongyloides ratti TaxID=34506 RepID=A0A090L5J0_STRRB|nr:Hypothetical protein SRAE_1000099400 [Strongyloides ratti]CEF62724.2 Hypothetical protein SRAE_1000099400 [Strongyloides ratti]
MGIIISRLCVKRGGIEIPLVIYIALAIIFNVLFIIGGTIQTISLARSIPNPITKLQLLKKHFKKKKKTSSSSVDKVKNVTPKKRNRKKIF